MVIDVRHYLTVSGRDPFEEWFDSLNNPKAQARVAVRINRLAAGNFGDHKAVEDGVWELRIDWGPGYRVYYALAGRAVVLLLCGGYKRRQSAFLAGGVVYC
jgi:putative addiction module killer protein